MVRSAMIAAAAGCAVAAGAFAQVEAILYTDGPVPGVLGSATIWPTGLYRPAFSPDKNRWAIRANRTSGNDDEYIIVGSGTTGTVAVHGNGTASLNPPTAASVFYISERGLSINNAGTLAVSGSTTSRATTDTIWRINAGASPEIVVRQSDATYQRPGGLGTFLASIGGPSIANTGEVAFPFADSRSESTDRDAVYIWNGIANSYVEVFAEGAATNVSGRTLEDINVPEANAVRGSVFFGRDSVSGPTVLGVFGDLTGTTSDDKLLARWNESTSTLEEVYREGTVLDGVTIPPTPSVVGWLDAAGNSYGVSGGAFGVPATVFAFINGVKVLNLGEPVGGSVSGETWFNPANSPLLVSPVFALDRNAAGGYVMGGYTNNSDLTRNQVVIYVDSAGNRTELLRSGSSVTVNVNGTDVTRTILGFQQQDAAYAFALSNTHLYFLCTTTRADVPSTVEGDLFASIALPVPAPTCDNIDFNRDGLFPDDADLIDFLNVLAGGACSTDPAPGCNDIDFNNDGLFPDDSDLVVFLRVLAGGDCTE
jgi:hypothetical protein